jgi:glycosyltransferase involved in cell wall biosynthesis
MVNSERNYKLGLVNIVIPCFNAEIYIERFLDSIIEQTYNDLYLIIINDGSKDATDNVLRDKCFPKLRNKNIRYNYISQKNVGVNKSFNNALQYVDGEFITWSDPDDFLSPTSIQKKVDFLKLNSEFGFVRHNAKLVKESDVFREISIIKSSGKENIFDDLLFENNMPVTAGNFLLRSEALFDSLSGGKIVEGFRGQNWPLLLPISSKYKCGYIDEVLNTIVDRPNSLSDDQSYQDNIYRTIEHNKMLVTILNELDDSYYQHINLLNQKYQRKRFLLAVKDRAGADIVKYYNELSYKSFTSKIVYFLHKTKLLRAVLFLYKLAGAIK